MNEYDENLEFEQDAAQEQSAQEDGLEPDNGAYESAFLESADQNLRAFMREYPDVDELPQEVVHSIITTEQTPVEAYRGYLLELKDLEIAKLKQQLINRANTPGSALGRASINCDAFLNEFNSD